MINLSISFGLGPSRMLSSEELMSVLLVLSVKSYGIIPLSGFGTGKKESASPFSCSVNVPNERQASAKNQGPLFKATDKCSRNVRATISTFLDPQ